MIAVIHEFRHEKTHSEYMLTTKGADLHLRFRCINIRKICVISDCAFLIVL